MYSITFYNNCSIAVRKTTVYFAPAQIRRKRKARGSAVAVRQTINEANILTRAHGIERSFVL